MGAEQTTTTTPAAADAGTLAFLQSIALAVIDAYDKVSPLLSDTTKPIAAKFQAHHREHADALGKQAGAAAATAPNPSLTLVLIARLQPVADERGALTFASALENGVAETYAFTLDKLAGDDAIHLVATILPIVTGHSLVLGSSAGLTSASLFPNGAMEGTTVGDGVDPKLGFDPASFPVG